MAKKTQGPSKSPEKSNGGTPAQTPQPRAMPDEIETARYIAAMSGELAQMARAANLELLAYFLDMARMEATSGARPPKKPR